MSKKTSAIGKIYQALIYVFLYAPILVIGLFSFNGSANTYMFSNAAAMHALQNTVVLALCTAAVSTLLGVMAAVGIFNSRHKLYKRSLMLLTNVPMMNPEIVTGISMMLLFVFAGGLVHRSNVLGFWTLLIAHVTFSLPYVILNVIPKLHQFDMNIYEAAVDLGCKPVRAFFKTVFPEIFSGIITGCVMSFTLSLDDFIISYFTNGPSFQTLPIYIFSMTKKRVKPDMYALSFLMFLTILVLLILSNWMQARAEKREKGERQ